MALAALDVFVGIENLSMSLWPSQPSDSSVILMLWESAIAAEGLGPCRCASFWLDKALRTNNHSQHGRLFVLYKPIERADERTRTAYPAH